MVNKEEALRQAKKFIAENLAVILSLDCTNSTAKTRRRLQHLASIRNGTKEVQTIYEIVLTAAIRAEKVSPQSGEILLKMFVGEFNGLSTVLRTKNDVRNHLRALSLSPKCLGILEETLELCTVNSKISLGKSSSDNSYIEVFEGYTFKIKPLLKSNNLVFEKPKVACIDGFIENVSELHHLLLGLSETKSTCLLFVRGASDEVTYTLKTNIDRGTVFAYPYVVPYDLENVNTLVDIAVVSGTDVISTTKGELISTVTLDKLGSIQSAVFKDDMITMKNFTARRAVQEHAKRLKKNMEDRQEVTEYMSNRLKSLSSSSVQINLSEDINFYSNTQQLDEGIRLISAFISNTYSPIDTANFFYASVQKTIESMSSVYFE